MAITNISKVSSGETWASITTTWATETRTWEGMSFFTDNSRIISSVTNQGMSNTSPLWYPKTMVWQLALPWQYTITTGITNINRPS